MEQSGTASLIPLQPIQNAIDAASIKGGIVLIPIGRFLCKGNLEIKMGVHLKGLNEVPQSWEPQTGSILMPTADKNNDNEDAPGFIECGHRPR